MSNSWNSGAAGGIPPVMRAQIALLVAAATSAAMPQVPFRQAPELQGSDWLNADAPIRLSSRKGKVTIVHFWTFQCSNCRANLAAYERLRQKYQPLGVEMIGIHTPELPAERSKGNVQDAIKNLAIRFPVLLDPLGANWQAFRQEYWPTVYLIDRKGRIRYTWVGEFGYRGLHGEQNVAKWLDILLKEPS